MTTVSQDKKALIVIDVQNDFLPKGSLAIDGGDEIIEKINQLTEKYQHNIFTQDWHPENHISFAENHEGKAPFDTIETFYGLQKLWPRHCVQGTSGADFPEALNTNPAELILRKGLYKDIDSYSAFLENDKITSTGLHKYLKEKDIKILSFCGLATDFCVGYSALDALKFGFKVEIILNACRAVDHNNSLDHMLKKLNNHGAELLINA